MKHFYFMNDGFCGHADEGFSYFYEHDFAAGFDGNVVKSCTAFWIRRSIDGTDDEFYAGLETLIRTYDPELYQRFQ